MASDTPPPSTPITLDAALDILRDLHARVMKRQAKPSEVRAMRHDAPLLTALAARSGSEVDQLLEQMRDVRGFAQPIDAIRVEIAHRRNHDTSTKINMGVWDQLKLKIKADGTRGGPEPTLLNAERVLRLEPVWDTRIRHNDFARAVYVDGHEIRDIDEIDAAIWLDERYGLKIPVGMVHDAMQAVGHQQAYHPVRDYLDGLEWDTDTRIDYWLAEYCGSPDKTIIRAYARRWMISAVARIMDPGCKVDTTLILKGEQGKKKSWAFRTLCGSSWFSDTVIDLRNKDAMQSLQGVWIYEFAELDSVKRADTIAVKAFLSSQSDRFRLPYARHIVSCPRQCVIVGTSNEDGFLRDPTGSRRFWPVETGAVDLDGLARARDQLWAEAVHLYRQGEQWWLTDDEEKRRVNSAHLFTEQDAWEDAILAWLVKTQSVEVRTAEVWEQALGKRNGDLTQLSQKRIGRILRDQGFERKHTRTGKVYRKL
jgi:putative DNA primase/helicase